MMVNVYGTNIGCNLELVPKQNCNLSKIEHYFALKKRAFGNVKLQIHRAYTFKF